VGLALVVERLIAADVIPGFARLWETWFRGARGVANRTADHANHRLVDADNVVAHPAPGNAVRREVMCCRLHA
jgi:hypothetical protein